MHQRQANAPPAIYALADHLDGVLAAGEDLLRLNGRHADMEWFLASVRRYEVAVILQVLRVREYVSELRTGDAAIATAAALFLGGTIAFTEASGAHVTSPFGSDPDDAAELRDFAITDEFAIGRRIPLSLLAELAAAFLNALEVSYILYDDGGARQRPSRPEMPVIAAPAPEVHLV